VHSRKPKSDDVGYKKMNLVSSKLGILNSTTRIPFRYGSACLTKCPQAVLRVEIREQGRTQAGYSGDCLPPSWFDKSPDKDFRQQIDEMFQVINMAQRTFTDVFRSGAEPERFFDGWLSAHYAVHQEAQTLRFTPLLASFGVSLVERAMMDAYLRLRGIGLATALKANVFGIVAGEVHPELQGKQPVDWLPEEPTLEVYVRHTVGLGDPLTAAEIDEEERLDDGLPQSLEQTIQQTGTQYLKIKLGNSLDHDIARLTTIAALTERHRGGDYKLTLDGNELYKSAADFDELIAAIESNESLQVLWGNTLAIEQPLARHIALEEEQTRGIRQLSQQKPVIIDESDGELHSYSKAIELGYRGVSSKNCKGPIRSILNAGLTWNQNLANPRPAYIMTGEDLCSVGVIPTQADLCLASCLGLTHVERNGHHYHPGLTYLPAQERDAAVAAHGDFYTRRGDMIVPHLRNGKFEIGSLHGVGFGFQVLPDMEARQSPDEWQFESLGL